DLQGRIDSMKFGPLDADTDQALTALAAQFPDLIKYDSARGMLRFAADLTFDSGSDVVKEDAKRAIAALGQILNNSSAAGYDVYIEGHTDSQRISANTAKRHPTNRHLSAHRAISVIEDLAKIGVKPGRMLAAGWGEWRPAVPNSASGNTPANRRVEIFLVKSSAGTMMLDESQIPAERSGSARPTREKPPAKPVDMSK
ncbi:MAG: OmpA family protein, partial [Phycisphaerales bacterium]